MVGLLAIRGGAVLARLVLSTGSWKAGLWYIAMEVFSLEQGCPALACGVCLGDNGKVTLRFLHALHLKPRYRESDQRHVFVTSGNVAITC